MFYYAFAYALWTNFLNGVNMLTLFASPEFDFWSIAKGAHRRHPTQTGAHERVSRIQASQLDVENK